MLFITTQGITNHQLLNYYTERRSECVESNESHDLKEILERENWHQLAAKPRTTYIQTLFQTMEWFN